MALSAKLTMRQGQTMVLTPQLLQAIKLLQMPNLELTQFIENELASNPLLERAEDREDPSPEPPDAAPDVADAPAEPGDWASEALETDAARPRRQSRHRGRQRFRLGPHRAAAQSTPGRRLERPRLDGPGVGADAGEAPDLEAYVAEALTLRDHLQRQAAILLADPAERMIGAALIDGLDEAGYFVGSIAEIAERLGAAADASSACSCACRASSRPECSRAPSPNAWRFSSKTRPFRSGDAGPDREPARARQARLSAVAPRLRRR